MEFMLIELLFCFYVAAQMANVINQQDKINFVVAISLGTFAVAIIMAVVFMFNILKEVL